MKLTRPGPGGLGVDVTDVDLADLSAEAAVEIKQLVYEHKLLVFREQALSEAAYVALGAKIGSPEPYYLAHYHHPDHPEIFVSSNVPMGGRKVGVAGTGRFWHADYQFMERPLSLTMIAPRQLPPGNRGTDFIDTVRAYEELPQELRAHVDGTTAFHEVTRYYKVQPHDVDKAISEIIAESRASSPGATHPTVIEHPVNGRKALFVSSGFTSSISGLDHEENQSVLQRLFAHLERDDRIHNHPWTLGDVILWDNRQLIHMASGYSRYQARQPSTSYRIGIYDEHPFYSNALPKGQPAAPRHWSAT